MTEAADHVSTFFGNYPTRTFEKGEVLIQAEEDPDGVFYLAEGRVNQYDITPTGNIVVVNVFKAGAFFPMAYAINRMPNHYFFEAATSIVTRKAPLDETIAFLRANPDVMLDLLSRIYRGAEGVLRRMAQLMGGDAKSRLRFELLNAAYRFGRQRADGSLLVPLAESDIGKHSGLARETVNRHLQELKKRGLIDIVRQGILIHDLRKLEALANDGF